MRRPLLLTVVAAGVALSAAGCGGTADGSASPTTGTSAPTTSAAAPSTAKFDACAVLPADALAKLGVTGPAKIDPDTGACQWTGSPFLIGTQIDNYPLGQRPKNGDTPTVTPLTIGSHKAELWRSETGGFCDVDLALGAQSFNIGLTAPDIARQVTGLVSRLDGLPHSRARSNGGTRAERPASCSSRLSRK